MAIWRHGSKMTPHATAIKTTMSVREKNVQKRRVFTNNLREKYLYMKSGAEVNTTEKS